MYMQFVDTKILFRHVAFLSSIQPNRSSPNIQSLFKSADYIEKEFVLYGLLTERQEWKARDNHYQNIIAHFKPNKAKRLVVGAHYDVHRNTPGADDNASGVAGLLETARVINSLNPNLNYGIDFVAYCLEEPPFFGTEFMGSFIHARSLFETQTKVLGMICYEMIGYYGGLPAKRESLPKDIYLEAPDEGKFIGVVSIQQYEKFHRKFYNAMKRADGGVTAFVQFPNESIPPSLSDNRNYWHFGYPALMLNDAPGGRNPNYHQPSDTVDTLDFESMSRVVDASIRAIQAF